jgi:predicted DNA-binding protein (MmcQ/YjbR family)
MKVVVLRPVRTLLSGPTGAEEAAMARDVNQAVREVCLWLPQAEEFVSHGSPNFRVRGGRTFATYLVNHHGDGRVALWLRSPAGAQEHYTLAEPKQFFVPPYVGPSGWLGVNLDKGISWQRVAQLVREAYETVAPSRLVAKIGKTIEIEQPKPLTTLQINPMLAPGPQRVLKGMCRICLALPECSAVGEFGHRVWLAGKKTFARMWHHAGRLQVSFWVGVERQGLLTADRRYEIPPYLGHQGWIALDVTRRCDWDEVRALALESYRHFALRRMLAALEMPQPRAQRAATSSQGRRAGSARSSASPRRRAHG